MANRHRRHLLRFALCSAVSMAVGSGIVMATTTTATWTDASGDQNWLNPANGPYSAALSFASYSVSPSQPGEFAPAAATVTAFDATSGGESGGTSGAAQIPVTGSLGINLSQSQGGYQYDGYSASLNVNGDVPVVAQVTANTGTKLPWGDDATWGGGGLGVAILNSISIAPTIANDIYGDFSPNDNINAIKVLNSPGPTEQTVSLDLGTLTLAGSGAYDVQGFPSAGVNISAGVTFEFDVTIPDSSDVIMNQQTVNLLNLTVGSGGVSIRKCVPSWGHL